VRLRFFFLAKVTGFLKIINFSLWLFNVLFYMLKQKDVKVMSAHSLKILPVCVLASILKGAKLIYDTHEIETHTTNNKRVISLLTLVEKICMFKVQEIIVTSPGHYAWYMDKYNIPVHLIRNCPSIKEKPRPYLEQKCNLKNKLGLTAGELLFVYIGVINVARGVNVILDAFQQCEKTKHILFLGFGDVKPIIRLAAENTNIHYLEPVHPMELVNFISTSDVGIHMMDSSNLNHRKALPNKPMQYMAAGLPCIVSDVEVMAGLVRDADSGWIVKEGDSEYLKVLVNRLTKADIQKYAINSQSWFVKNNWESESLKLIQIYEQFI